MSELITSAVQLLLDRFIFMKVLADREIEEDYIQFIVDKLKESRAKDTIVVYEEFQHIFEDLDKVYNGSIFT